MDKKSGKNTPKITKKRSIQLGDNIHVQRSAILRESKSIMCGNGHNILPLFGGFVDLSLSLLSSPLLHYEAHPHLSKSNYGVTPLFFIRK
jgi:hypothetical protein